jgi:protein-disulfide isomerase
MNNNNSVKILLVCFAVFSIIGAYYIGYMSARLGLSAPFIANTGTVKNPSDNTQAEPKLVEEVSPLELNGDEVTIGNPNSKVSMIVFTDFQCPFCARFHPGMMQVQQAENTKLVFKHFPLGFHQYAKDMAYTFECIAKNSGALNAEKFADEIFAENMKLQGQITFDATRKVANKFINDSTIDSCLKDNALISKVNADYQEGLALGIQGTPALYIQNSETGKAVRINGALDQAAVQAEFDKIK